MYKVLISYDMQKGKEQECQDYLVNKLAPGLARMGFQFADVWYTVWGNSPRSPAAVRWKAWKRRARFLPPLLGNVLRMGWTDWRTTSVYAWCAARKSMRTRLAG